MQWLIVGIAFVIVMVFVTAHLVRNARHPRGGHEGRPSGDAGNDTDGDGGGGGDSGD